LSALVARFAHAPEQQSCPLAQSLLDVHAALAPHWFACPPPPQVSEPAHVPQSRVPPQPSGSDPQLAPAIAQVVGAQVDPPQTPLEHVWPDGQAVPQAPQSSALVARLAHAPAQQLSPEAQSLLEVHAALAPHWFAFPPPPHVSPAPHVPQSIVPPQPSGNDPQLAPATAQVVGAHVACAQAPPAQVSPEGQSLLELHVSPQTLVEAQESPAGQSELCEHAMGCWSVPMGTLPFVQAPNAERAITTPSGNTVFQSTAGRAFMGISWPPVKDERRERKDVEGGVRLGGSGHTADATEARRDRTASRPVGVCPLRGRRLLPA
jgi:hypothetical protein